MKKITKILTAAFCGLALLASCQKQEIVQQPFFVLCTEGTADSLIVFGESKTTTQELNYFKYAAKAVAADSVLAATRYHVYSNCEWKIVPVGKDQDWIQPFPEDGGNAEGLLFFRADRNNDRASDRLAAYRFVLNNGVTDIEVGGSFMIHQVCAKPRLESNKKTVEVESAGGTASVKVTSNIAWTYSLKANEDYASEDPAIWTVDKTVLKYDDADSTILSLANTIKISCPDNSEGSIRGFSIILHATDAALGLADIVIPVTQYGAVADIEGFPVSWNAANNSFPKWPSASNNPPTLVPAEGSGSICFHRAEIAGLDRTASTCDVSGSNPRVNGAWPGDYFEFTADAPVPAASLIKLQFEARISGSGCRHWRLEYLDGTEWKVAGKLLETSAPDGSKVSYTQDMYPGGSGDEYNQIISQVVRYENTTSEVKFRWYVASNIIASSGAQMEKPTSASARLDYSGSTTGCEPSISCVAAGGEKLIYGDVTCSEDVLLFEGKPAGPQTLTVNSDQDYTISTNSDWITIDVVGAEAFTESSVKVTVAESTLNTMREGLITITSGMTRKGIRVIQSAAGQDLDPLISLSKNKVSIDGNAQEVKVKVQSNTEYTVTSDAAWVTLVETKAVNQEEKLFAVEANPSSTDERVAHVVFANEKAGIESVLTIVQAPLALVQNVRIAEWAFSADRMDQYKTTFGGTTAVNDKAAGDGGLYVAANVKGDAKITYVQVDKTTIDTNGKAARLVGGTGHPFVYGAWVGDYWLFTVNYDFKALDLVHGYFKTRCSATGLKYQMLEWLDGEEWKPLFETKTATVSGETITYNFAQAATDQDVDWYVQLPAATKQLQVRMRVMALEQCSGSILAAPNGGTSRIAGADDGVSLSPYIEIVNVPKETEVYSDDFSWLAPCITAYNTANPSTPVGDFVGTDYGSVSTQSGAKAPNAYTDATLSSLFPNALKAAGYTDLNPSGKVIYPQDTYLKLGKTSVHTGLQFSPFTSLTAATDVDLYFDWCAHFTSSGNVDQVHIMAVLEGDGYFLATGTKESPAILTTQAAGEHYWQNVRFCIKGATASTKLTIISKEGKASFTTTGAFRYHLDNILIVK